MQLGARTQEVEPIWNDEDTRSFYEDLPQLRVLLPAVLFGDSKKDEAEVINANANLLSPPRQGTHVVVVVAADTLPGLLVV